jgi:PP-loop superfamily ATP-utilizing enzyme
LSAHSEEITATLKQIGFDRITLDLEGFASGSFDSKMKGGKDV